MYESAQWKSQFSSSKEEQEKAKKQQQKEEAKREALINSLHTERATPGLLKSNFDKTSTATKESIAKDMLNKHGYILDLHDTYPNGTIDTLDDYKAIYDAVDTVTSFFGNIALEHFNSSQVLQNPDGSYNYNAIAWCSMYPWKRAGLTLRGWPDNDYKQRQANYGYYKKCKDKIAAGTANSTDKEDGRFSRWTVEVAGRNPTLSVIMHEMLHAAKHTILGHDYDDVIKEVMDYAISRGDDAKYISQYSTHRETDKNTGELLAPNFEEFYVESAMAYLNGEKLPQYIRDMVELPIKVRNGEIKKEDLVWGCSTYPKKTKKSGGNKQ